MEITMEVLEQAAKNGFNVLLQGEAGTGKTTMVLDTFNKFNLKFKYFSASTMDPFLDFVGMPKERTEQVTDPVTGVIRSKSYIDLVLPKEFADDEVEAIFLDEYNRAHKKVRNAVMELIQFKSINGRVFKKLKLVWAAINPDDTMVKDANYDVEPLDKAQRDRFHIQGEVAFRPSHEFFCAKYGKTAAEVAISWWNGIEDKHKHLCSPRRLDNALELNKVNIDLRFVLAKETNPTKLQNSLKTGPILDKMNDIIDRNATEEGRIFIQDANNYFNAQEYLKKEDTTRYSDFFLHLVKKESFVALIQDQKHLRNLVQRNPAKYVDHLKMLRDSQMKKYSEWAQSLLLLLEANPLVADIKNFKNPNADPAQFLIKMDELISYLETHRGTGETIKRYQETFKFMPAPDSLAKESKTKLLMVCQHFVARHAATDLGLNLPLVVPIVRHFWNSLDQLLPDGGSGLKQFQPKLDHYENSRTSVDLE